MIQNSFYAIEIDNCYWTGFPFSTIYFLGTLKDIENYIDLIIKRDKDLDYYKNLIEIKNVIERSKIENNTTLIENNASLTPVTIYRLAGISSKKPYSWEHINFWGFPYGMKCDGYDIKTIWCEINNSFYRMYDISMKNLEYNAPGLSDNYKPLGMYLGHPHLFSFENKNDAHIMKTNLFIPEKIFDSEKGLKEDVEKYKPHNIDFRTFCNEIFADG